MTRASLPSPERTRRRLLFLLLAAAVLAVGIALPTPAGMTPAAQRILALLAFAVILWITEALDYAVSALIVAVLMVFLLSTVPDATSGGLAPLGSRAALRLALAGFANPALALVTAALLLSLAVQDTGLDRRIALHILRVMGAKPRQVVAGVIIVGAVLSLIVPTATARVACLTPIMLGIIRVFGVEKRGRFASLIMIAVCQTASLWDLGIKTAAGQNILAVGFIERELGTTITWLSWFVAAAPFALLGSMGTYCILLWMLPPEVEAIPGGREAIREAVRNLGPVPPAQWRLLALSAALLLAWMTEHVWHPLDTATVTMAAAGLLLLPGIGVLDWKSVQARLPLGTLAIFGVGIALGSALLRTRAAEWLSGAALAGLGLGTVTPLALLAALGALLIVLHVGFTSSAALTAAMIPILISVLRTVHSPGLNVVGMVMLLQLTVSFEFILPVNSPHNLLAYASGTYSMRDFVRTGLVITLFCYALLLLFGMTYWRWLGIL